MAVHLRLSRVGRKKVPFFRIVAIDSRKSRDGQAIDILGTYDALSRKIISIDMAGIDSWVGKGAQMLDSVKKIYKLAKRSGLEVASSVTPVAAVEVVEA